MNNQKFKQLLILIKKTKHMYYELHTILKGKEVATIFRIQKNAAYLKLRKVGRSLNKPRPYCIMIEELCIFYGLAPHRILNQLNCNKNKKNLFYLSKNPKLNSYEI